VAGNSRGRAAREEAYDVVKERILRGVYTGGDLISEGEVSASLGTSRTPVREAFLRLEAEGLLRLYPQRGALVVPVSPHEVQTVLEARTLLERFAVGKILDGPPAARKALGDELADDVERQRAAAAGGDLDGFVEHDRHFHTRLLAAAENDLLAHFYDSLRDRQVRMVAESVLNDPGRRETIVAEHAQIADAIRDGDTARAQDAVERHIASTRTALGLGGG
jgi:DNA-binding GntR family transcriptional regulator